jgi:hypothetical protein
MCTVSFLPLAAKQFILTSNRDEAIKRPSALPFAEYRIHNKIVYFPKDQKANGTWIAHDLNGLTLCLLNGAFEKHTIKKNYRLSRGLMLLDVYRFSSPNDFIELYDFNDIEPFTLIIIDPIVFPLSLKELRWDGSQTHVKVLDASRPKIWSSATLYTNETRQLRECTHNKKSSTFTILKVEKALKRTLFLKMKIRKL